MPNYNIPTRLRDMLKRNALKLAARPLALAMKDFPLTTTQLQYHCSALTGEQVDTLRRLDGDGVRTIEHHRRLRLAFIRDNLPELRRGVVVMIQLPEWIVVGKRTQWGITTTSFKPDESHYIVPSLAWADAKDRRALVTWINQALRQVRLYEITDYMVGTALDEKHTPTTSHLHAFWPVLTKLVESEHVHGRQYEQEAIWRGRFRNPTRSLKAYQPDTDVKNKYAPLIRAADTMIAAGMVLPETVTGLDHSQVVATIEHWERIPGDPTFPLPD